jgi:hypothetical protein
MCKNLSRPDHFCTSYNKWNCNRESDEFRIQSPPFNVTSPPFNVTFPENNVFGISLGQTQAVSDGLWIILKPLPPGEHRIGFKGSSVDFTAGATNTFVSDATYDVIVR